MGVITRGAKSSPNDPKIPTEKVIRVNLLNIFLNFLTFFSLYYYRKLFFTIVLIFLIASIDTRLTAINLIKKFNLNKFKNRSNFRIFVTALDIAQRIPLILVLVDVLILVCF